MCEQRENLVAYLYDEVDANERRTVETHLSTCETCREELRALRDVRQDLLAWDVPAHGSVWKPFVTTRTQPVWRQMPVWAMAAAAMLVFAIGGVGGYAGRVLAARADAPRVASPAGASAQAGAVQPAAESATVTPAATREELLALQARLGQLERAASVRTVSSAPASMSAQADAATMAKIEQLIRESEGRSNRLLSKQIWNIVGELNSQRLAERANFEQKINETQAQINGTMLRVMNSRSPQKEQ